MAGVSILITSSGTYICFSFPIIPYCYVMYFFHSHFSNPDTWFAAAQSQSLAWLDSVTSDPMLEQSLAVNNVVIQGLTELLGQYNGQL